MLPYAAYLRVYEPLSAFPEPDRSIWARYAASPDRPRRVAALEAEHGATVRRLVARPPVVAPARESADAYVRRTTETTFVCPWQTRLRSWLAFSAFQAALPRAVTDAFVPRIVADQVEADFERWKRQGDTPWSHILSSTWQVPFVWFIPFSATERCLVLGSADRPAPGDAPSTSGISGGTGTSSARPGTVGGPTTAVPIRTLIYVTSMAQARRRTAAAGKALRIASGAGDCGFGAGDVGALGRWLEGFHPGALVELDYGGLVHLMDDEALRTDESVAEVAAALDGIVRDPVVARAMHERLRRRWRSVQMLSTAN